MPWQNRSAIVSHSERPDFIYNNEFYNTGLTSISEIHKYLIHKIHIFLGTMTPITPQTMCQGKQK